MHLVMFDDARARLWAPFASTRPVGELRYGAMLLRERVERVAGVPCSAHRAGEALEGWDEPGAPPCSTPGAPGGAMLYWSSRAVPELSAELSGEGAATVRIGGEVVGWRVPEGGDPPPDEAFLDPGSHAPGPDVEVAGEILPWPWDLVDRNARRLADDLARLHPRAGRAPDGVITMGEGGVSLGEGASIEPGVVVDTRAGAVRLDERARVEGPARLVGPLHLGPDSVVFGGSVGTSSVGPWCKLRGEIDACVFLGFANKAHDGYLGHALVGRWVNLGAGTINSDLKNSYSPVRVELPHGTEDTGLLKVGSLLGDHVKTGIGTLLTTGAVVGAATNLFGGGTPPRAVPPFTWLGPEGAVPYRFEKFVEVARAAMARRDQRLTDGALAVLERLARGLGEDR